MSDPDEPFTIWDWIKRNVIDLGDPEVPWTYGIYFDQDKQEKEGLWVVAAAEPETGLVKGDRVIALDGETVNEEPGNDEFRQKLKNLQRATLTIERPTKLGPTAGE